MSPDAVILRERVAEGPTRRIVWHPLTTGAYERKEQLWREAIGDWHTMGTEVVESLRLDCPEGRR